MIAIVAVALIFFLPVVHQHSSEHPKPNHSTPIELFDRRSRLTIYVGAVALAFLVVWLPVSLPQVMGPLGILFAFVAIVTPILAHIAFVGDRHGVPYLTIIVGLVLVISAFDLNDNHTLYRQAAKPADASVISSKLPGAEEAFRDWFDNRPGPDRLRYETTGRRYPVYVVAAEGGGIYAAFHAASVLGGLQDRCPAFADHLFSISGVSGGSLGAATFAAGLRHAQESNWPSAKNGPCVDAEPPQPRERSMVDFADSLLSSDLLSPLAAGLLFPDMLQKLLIFPVDSLDRTRYFEAAFEASLDNAIVDRQARKQKSTAIVNFLRMPFLQHWSPLAHTPALLINATEVGSGRLRIIAPFLFNTDHVLFLPFADTELAKRVGGSLDNLPISAAVITSARFPWVTPAGSFYDWSFDPTTNLAAGRSIEKIRLVDGGYFENSGVAAAMELISSMQSASRRYEFADKIAIRLIVLTRGGFPKQGFLGLSELISPVVALLSARSSRAPLIIDQTERLLRERAAAHVTPSINISKVELLDLYYPLPLGWRLSALSTILIQAQNGIPTRCEDTSVAYQNETTFDADCLAKAVREELN